jgi:hypothetical protein
MRACHDTGKNLKPANITPNLHKYWFLLKLQKITAKISPGPMASKKFNLCFLKPIFEKKKAFFFHKF